MENEELCGAIKYGTACGGPDYRRVYRCNLPKDHGGNWHKETYPSGGAECWPVRRNMYIQFGSGYLFAEPVGGNPVPKLSWWKRMKRDLLFWWNTKRVKITLTKDTVTKRPDGSVAIDVNKLHEQLFEKEKKED